MGGIASVMPPPAKGLWEHAEGTRGRAWRGSGGSRGLKEQQVQSFSVLSWGPASPKT